MKRLTTAMKNTTERNIKAMIIIMMAVGIALSIILL
jgi:hypothetical protein